MRQQTSSNPMLNETRLRSFANTRTQNEVMTANGAVNKTALLLTIVFASALTGWSLFPPGYSAIFGIGGFIVAMVTAFNPKIAGLTAPIYAVLEGLLLGGISQLLEQSYPGIALQAVIGTIGVFILMMLLYRTGVIKVTDRFRSIIVSAMMGIVFVYLGSFILSFFMPALPLFSGGLIGIGFSLFVIIIAAFSLLLDFDMIEKAETFGAPKYMEWYCAFSLLVTLIWLYFEILRLLSYLRGR